MVTTRSIFDCRVLLHHGPAEADEVAPTPHQRLDDVATPDVVVAAELPRAVDPDVGQEEVGGGELGSEGRVHAAQGDHAEGDHVLLGVEAGLGRGLALELVDPVEIQDVVPDTHVELDLPGGGRLFDGSVNRVAELVGIAPGVEAGRLDGVDPPARQRRVVAHRTQEV